MEVSNESAAPSRRFALSALPQHPVFSKTVLFLILLNALLVGLETYPALYEPAAFWFQAADKALLWLFTIELIIRIAAARSVVTFAMDRWNVFDFLIIACGHVFSASSFITVLRMLRVLRVLRAVSVIPSLRKIVTALLLTIPSIGNITLLLALLFYVFGVIGTSLFSTLAPDYFGSFHETALTLFQIILLDGVMDILRPLLEASPWAWVYFFSFILIGSFVIFNLFVGVIVNNLEQVDKPHHSADPSEPSEELREELTQLRGEIAELKLLLRGKTDEFTKQ